MKKLLLTFCSIALVSGGIAMAASHSNAIADRKAAMKSVGGAMGALAKMAKGEMDFSADVALASLQKMNEVAKSYGDLFPAGTETGGETTASPAIWSDADGFKAALAKFEVDTAAAVASPPADQASLGAVMGSVGGNCKACHQTFRIKK